MYLGETHETFIDVDGIAAELNIAHPIWPRADDVDYDPMWEEIAPAACDLAAGPKITVRIVPCVNS